MTEDNFYYYRKSYIDRQVYDFLLNHKNATEIVMNERTGLPHKAVYSGVDKTGNIRTKPAEYFFELYGEER